MYNSFNSILKVIFVISNISVLSGMTICKNETQCNYGKCINSNCVCDTGYVTYNNITCNYKQKEKLTAFLLSFLIGSTGADWFYLAQSNTGYIVAGVFKLLTGIAGFILPCVFCCFGFMCSKKSKAAGYICVTIIVSLATMANGIWWLVDWIRILTGSFKDGNNIGLKNW